MFELLTINGVRCYLDKQGTAHLHVEDVVRGLGFIETKDGKEYGQATPGHGCLA